MNIGQPNNLDACVLLTAAPTMVRGRSRCIRSFRHAEPTRSLRRLKRFVARQLFKLLECCDQLDAEILHAA